MTLTRAQGYELYKNQHLYVDRVEQVTITSVDDASLTITGVYAKPKPFSHKVSKTSLGEVDTRERGWILYDVSLLGNVPRRGWVLTQADGTAWSLKDGFDQNEWGTQWHCTGTQEVPDDFERVVV